MRGRFIDYSVSVYGYFYFKEWGMSEKILLLIVFLFIAFSIGRFFPYQSIRSSIWIKGRDDSRKKNAESLCGLWICTARDPGVELGPFGAGDMPFLVLERDNARLVIMQEHNSPIVTPGKKVRVRLRDAGEVVWSYLGEHGAFVKAELVVE